MRVERAIDAFLDWRRLERDATPRSTDSYRRILWKLTEDYPELISPFTKYDLRAFFKRWEDQSAATRSNVISCFTRSSHGAVAEDLIEVDPAANLRRPKKRKAECKPPQPRPARRPTRGGPPPRSQRRSVLMEGAGLRRAEDWRPLG